MNNILKLLLVAAVFQLITGCSNQMPRYSSDHQIKNQIGQWPLRKFISVSEFTSFDQGQSIKCRTSTNIPAYGSYHKDMELALILELALSDLYYKPLKNTEAQSLIGKMNLQGHLTKIESGNSKWVIGVELTSNNGKSISEEISYKHEYYFNGDKYCREVRKAYPIAINMLYRKLLTKENLIELLPKDVLVAIKEEIKRLVSIREAEQQAANKQRAEMDARRAIASEKHDVDVKYVSSVIRRNGLADYVDEWGHSEQVCTWLKRGRIRIGAFDCEDYVSSSRRNSAPVRSCERAQQDLIDRYKRDSREPCSTARTREEKVMSMFEKRYSKAVISMRNRSDGANVRAKRTMDEYYSYHNSGFRDDMEKYLRQANRDMEDAEDDAEIATFKQQHATSSNYWENIGKPSAVDKVWEQNQANIRSFVNKSTPSKDNSASRNVISNYQKKLPSIDSRSTNSRTVSAAPQRNLEAECVAKGGTYTASIKDCTIIKQRTKYTESSKSKAPTGKRGLAFCYERTKPRNNTWRCHGPTAYVLLFEPIEKALYQAGCSDNSILESGVSLTSRSNGKTYAGNLYSCNKNLHPADRDMRKQYDGIPVNHL